MTKKRNRRKVFDDRCDLRPAMHWLRRNGVNRTYIAHLFGESDNYVSVADKKERKDVPARALAVSPIEPPDFASVEAGFSASRPNPYEDRERSVEEFGVHFWANVRGLGGLLDLGHELRKVSAPDRENYELLRLRARLKHLTAEMYLHAGYAKTALKHCYDAILEHQRIIEQTNSRLDTERFAKTCLLASSAHLMREEFRAALQELDLAQNAYLAAQVPIDPEVSRQRASIALQSGEVESARALYRRAFDEFPAHREHLGYGCTVYARHDVGKRPLALLDKDFAAAQRNLETSSAWPAGDIHHSINLNLAIAVGFQTDSGSTRTEALKLLPRAREAAQGYGRQAATVGLLELTPQIPDELQAHWTVFAVQFNAYRNK